MYDPALIAMFREDHTSKGIQHLPNRTLAKLACGGGLLGDNKSWIDRFQGSPLFDQAYELEQEKLQYETGHLQHREQMQQLYSAEDQLRIKRRMLELALAKEQQAQAAPPPAAPQPEMAAPPPQPVPEQPAAEPAKTAAPLDLLRWMAKEAAPTPLGVGKALGWTARRNPGAILGGLGGAVLGGVHGAKETIDPATGQPVGGGVMGAAKGALLGGAVGGAGGLLAQGAIRSGLGAHRNMQHMANKKSITLPSGEVVHSEHGFAAPGGYSGQLVNQALSRANAFAGNLQVLGKSLNAPLTNARQWFGKQIDAHRIANGAPTPLPAPTVAPPPAAAGV